MHLAHLFYTNVFDNVFSSNINDNESIQADAARIIAGAIHLISLQNLYR